MNTYLPGLNTLRLYAALSVLLGHLWSYAGDDYPPLWLKDVVGFVTLNGRESVELFFVLSGFLITLLLLRERVHTGDIDTRAFMWRRARRILPLYFFVMAITWLLTPLLSTRYETGVPDALGTVSLLALSPHIGAAFGSIGFLSHYHSLGVEEWFYGVWSWVVRRFGLLHIIGAIIVIRVLLTALLAPDAWWLVLDFHEVSPLAHFLFMTTYECMAYGALGAYLLHTRSKWLYVVYRWDKLIWLLFALLIVSPTGNVGGFIYTHICGIVFMALLVNVASNPRTWLNIERPMLSYLGQRTYGVYVYQQLAILIAAWLMPGSAALVVVVPALTVAVALVSYRWFEYPLLSSSPRTNVLESPVKA